MPGFVFLRSRLVISLLLCAGIFGLVAGATFLVSRIPRSCVYCVATSFHQLPENDEPLVEWLKGQPGVVSHTVHVRRGEATDGRVEIVFAQVRTLAGDPPFPSVEAKCEELGYRAATSPFVDCSR